MNLDVSTLRCPTCHHARMRTNDRAYSCEECGGAYSRVNGLIDLRPLRDEAPETSVQVAFYDEDVDRRWEIERPRTAPRFHRWLIEEKYRRGVAAIRPVMEDGSVLVVCGGSGMDAELIAPTAAFVVTSDISFEASVRAVERSRRHDVSFATVVADAYDLPFADRTFDVVYAHDGLHHLDRPFDGLREMARVARRGVSITEPADAAVTKVAVRVGLAQEIEDAGNRVARLRASSVMAVLAEQGFRTVTVARYAMFYRHEPGWVSHLLSAPGLFAAARGAVALVNGIAGRLGNKLTVQAIREESS